jgi:uncharacterized phage-associated protein
MAKIYDFITRTEKNMETTIVHTAETTVEEIAKGFLSIQPMSHKKLQKLCYYAYSWYLTLYNRKLFDNRFEAWIHGPVDPILYQRYKDWGWQEIQENTEDLHLENNHMSFVHKVFKSYGHLNGNQLEYLSHTEDPWLEARGELAEYEPCITQIEDDIIRRFYLKVQADERRV